MVTKIVSSREKRDHPSPYDPDPRALRSSVYTTLCTKYFESHLSHSYLLRGTTGKVTQPSHYGDRLFSDQLLSQDSDFTTSITCLLLILLPSPCERFSSPGDTDIHCLIMDLSITASALNNNRQAGSQINGIYPLDLACRTTTPPLFRQFLSETTRHELTLHSLLHQGHGPGAINSHSASKFTSFF